MAEDSNWERKTLEKVALASIDEQRRGRRWGIFFKLLGFAYLAVVLVMLVDWDAMQTEGEGEKHTALVELHGVIEAKGDANADDIIGALQSAYDNKHTAGVVLRVNSPGGSPVQAGIINDEIHRLRNKHQNIPLYVVVEDVCASGG